MAKLEDIDAKLDYLEITKALIKEAIENKGQEIEETDTFREFVNKISNIQTKSNFHHLVVGTTNYNIQVDDTLTFGATLGTYKVNDYELVRLYINNSSIGQYTYRVGVIEITGVTPVSNATESVNSKVLYIFDIDFPKFIENSLDKKGILFGNEVTGQEYNWYSYDYSNLDVQSQDVLTNKRFQGPTGIETGSMPNNGELNYTPTSSAQTIPAGYTSGGTISAMDITISSDYIRCLALSKNILGIE